MSLKNIYGFIIASPLCVECADIIASDDFLRGAGLFAGARNQGQIVAHNLRLPGRLRIHLKKGSAVIVRHQG